MADREQQGGPLPESIDTAIRAYWDTGVSFGRFQAIGFSHAWSPAQADKCLDALEAAIRNHAAAARREALEEAAQACLDKERRKWEIFKHGGKLEGIGPLDCAAAVRALLRADDQPASLDGLEVEDSSFGEWVESGGTPL